MKTKVVPELFLEVAELNRFEKGLRDDGFVADKISETNSWGVVRNLTIDPNFNFFKIVKTADVDKFRINNGFGFDKDRLMFTNKYGTTDIQIPLQNQPYWVKVSHQYESREIGTVKVGSTSNKSILAGVGTEFTKVLRGQPNFPSKIRFLNSTMYTLDYEVLEVIDDNNILINGIFDVLEDNLQYGVVGTFSAGVQVPDPNKMIFQYDSFNIAMVADTGNPPVLIDGKEFIIGRVQYNNSGTVVEDYRFNCIYSSVDMNHVDSISTTLNKITGIENVKKFTLGSNQFYVCGIDWKFNILSEVQQNDLGVVSIASGYGGVWLSGQQFVDGDMDGWRYYYEDGNYSIVLSSIKQGTQSILLYLDSVRIGSGNGIYITPNAEDIEIEAVLLNTGGDKVFSKNYFFSITQNNPTIQLSKEELLFSNQRVRLYSKLKNNFKRTQALQFNQSTYFNPAAYNSQGVLIDNTQTTTDLDIVLDNVASGSNLLVPKRIGMAWYPETPEQVAQFFDVTNGEGIGGDFIGWQMLTGLTGADGQVIPDWRGRQPIGASNTAQVIGGVLATDVNYATNPTKAIQINIGATGGEQKHQLTLAELAAHGHNTDVEVVDEGHVHNIQIKKSGNGGGGDTDAAWNRNFGDDFVVQTDSATTGIGVNVTVESNGGDTPHNNLQPYTGVVWVWRIS